MLSSPDILDGASRWAAEFWLEKRLDEVARCLELARTSPNSALLLLYEHGDDLAAAYSNRESLTDESRHRAVEPQKSVYVPCASLTQLVGIAPIPTFTYSKTTDVPVVVLLCGLGDQRDDTYHTTLVYTPSSSSSSTL